MPKTIIIDPGHGGFDPGAVFDNRREKDDNLRLALAVGQELQNAGYHIIYTRTDDRYDSPYDKAQIANNAGGDLFLSFHRNYAEQPDLYQGVQALVGDDEGAAHAALAEHAGRVLDAAEHLRVAVWQERQGGAQDPLVEAAVCRAESVHRAPLEQNS